MKYHTFSTNVNFRWDQVCSSLFRRYPNPWSAHVLTEDVISREVEGPILKTFRIITKTNRLPKVLDRFVACNVGFVVEESHINREKQSIVTYTRNMSLKSVLVVDERCEYTVSPDSTSWTLMKRQAWFMSSMYGLRRRLEGKAMERYRNNVAKTVQGLEYILKKMHIPDKIPSSINAIPFPQIQ